MKTILCEGASNTLGAPANQAWPERLADMTGDAVINRGLNSQTITDCRRVITPPWPHFRTPTMLTRLPDDLTPLIDIVILSPCNMDAHIATTHADQLTLTPTRVVQMLTAYIHIVRCYPHATITPFVCTSPMIPVQVGTPAEAFIREQNALIRARWNAAQIIDVEDIKAPELYIDGAHLGDTGHALWAERAYFAVTGGGA